MRIAPFVLTVAGCWSEAASTQPSAPLVLTAFTPPATIGDCRGGRLEVVNEELDVGKPYQSWHWRALELFARRHSHVTGETLVLLVPTVDRTENVTAIEARRFAIRSARWLPTATVAVGGHPRLAPRFTEIESGWIGGELVVQWTNMLQQKTARRFSPADGTWSDSLPTNVPARNGLSTHAAFPAKPDPTTRVTLEVSGEHRTATASRGGQLLGTIKFASRPGAYIGAFPNTRTAFVWNNQRDETQRGFPTAERYESYLIGLETGAACRIARELAFDGGAVFRTRSAIVMVNVLRTEDEQSSCPPGAPCVAPAQSHFRGVSVTTFRDRGP